MDGSSNIHLQVLFRTTLPTKNDPDQQKPLPQILIQAPRSSPNCYYHQHICNQQISVHSKLLSLPENAPQQQNNVSVLPIFHLTSSKRTASFSSCSWLLNLSAKFDVTFPLKFGHEIFIGGIVNHARVELMGPRTSTVQESTFSFDGLQEPLVSEKPAVNNMYSSHAKKLALYYSTQNSNLPPRQ